MLGNKAFIENLMLERDSIMETSDEYILHSQAVRDLDEAFVNFGGPEKYLEQVDAIIRDTRTMKKTTEELNRASIANSFLPPGLKAEREEELRVLREKNKLLGIDLEIKGKLQAMLEATKPADREKLAQELTDLGQKYITQEASIEQAERAATGTQKILTKLGSSIESNLISNINAVIDGTKSMKQAFADMAIAVLKDISQIIVKLMVMKALQQTGLSIFNAESGGTTPPVVEPLKKGGIIRPKEYARGGIAKAITRRDGSGGYPAILHGAEAVVPLPDGRSIPVNMTGGANNITVNVSGSGGGATQTQGRDNEGLGRAIAQAVQAELQNQKRSGGILNPYGAA